MNVDAKDYVKTKTKRQAALLVCDWDFQQGTTDVVWVHAFSSKAMFRQTILHTITTENNIENKEKRRIFKTGLGLTQKFTTSKLKERSIRIGWLWNDEHIIKNSKKKKKEWRKWKSLLGWRKL